MSFRSDFLKIMNGEKPEKFPATEYMMFWPETVTEYSKIIGQSNLPDYFGVATPINIPYNFCALPAFEEIVYEETDTHITKRNAEGIVYKIEKGTSAMPHYIEFPIKDRASFEEYKKRLDYNTAERVPDLKYFIQYVRENDTLTQITIRGPFAFLRDFINFEEMMFLFIDDPELIEDMMKFHADFVVGLFKRVFSQFIPDIVCLGEDMAYKTSSMISPAMVERFIYPAWKKIIDYVKSVGVKHIFLDSDGHSEDIIPIAIKAGFTATSPIECAAGMDIEKLRKKFPTFGFIGGIDKLELAKGKEEIDKQIEKAERVYRTGRYIPSCDHSVPPIVSFENYKYYISKLKAKLEF